MEPFSQALTSGWADFFVMSGGAAAALAGLLFVSVSINLEKIVSFPHLPGRAVEALVVLMSVLAVSCCGAAPSQPDIAIGLEFLLICATAMVLSTRIQFRAGKHHWWWMARRVFRNQFAVLPFGISGLAILAGGRSGIYWVVPGIVLSMIAGVVNAWVLLVDVHKEAAR